MFAANIDKNVDFAPAISVKSVVGCGIYKNQRQLLSISLFFITFANIITRSPKAPFRQAYDCFRDDELR